MLGHLLQPPALLVGERLARGLLLRHPRLEVGGHALGVRHQLVLLVHGVAHQRDEVGEDAPGARALDLGLVQRGVGLPELAFGPQVRRGLQRVGQRLQVFELQRRLGRAVVEDLQRGDLVLVLLDELLEGADDLACARSRAASEKPASSTLVLRDGVDDLLVLLLEREDQLAQLGVGERLDGGLRRRGRLLRRLDRARARRRGRAPGP